MWARSWSWGTGHLPSGQAGREVWPQTREQHRWMHQIANVLRQGPWPAPAQVKWALHEMMYAEGRAACEVAMHRFAQDYHAKYPKAIKSLVTDDSRLLTRFEFPSAHWKHILSTNPIEFTFESTLLR